MLLLYYIVCWCLMAGIISRFVSQEIKNKKFRWYHVFGYTVGLLLAPLLFPFVIGWELCEKRLEETEE